VVFGVIMVVLLLSGAIAITFTDFMIESLRGTKRVFFVVLLLAYSVYRCFRIYQVVKYNRNQE